MQAAGAARVDGYNAAVALGDRWLGKQPGAGWVESSWRRQRHPGAKLPHSDRDDS